MCNINYPNVNRFFKCVVCGQDTNSFSNVPVDEDWLNMAVEKAKAWDGEIPDHPPS